jgi:hypothetical protein
MEEDHLSEMVFMDWNLCFPPRWIDQNLICSWQQSSSASSIPTSESPPHKTDPVPESPGSEGGTPSVAEPAATE